MGLLAEISYWLYIERRNMGRCKADGMVINISDKYTPQSIFRAIDNQSVNRQVGESLIERYGDQCVMKAIADLQEKMGIELSEEIGKRITSIGQLIDEFYGMMIEINSVRK
jgi:hypothetical protein